MDSLVIEMNSPSETLEIAVLIILIGWLLGSILYALPFPSLRRLLGEFNWGLWFAHWTVFGAGDQRAEMASYSFSYRDGANSDGRWIEVIRGRPWSWHAFFWQPERRVADRLHRLAEGIARTHDFTAETARAALISRQRLIANYIDARHPRVRGMPRMVRVTIKRSILSDYISGGSQPDIRLEERVLLSFSADTFADEF
jgi:hypothetical protein